MASVSNRKESSSIRTSKVKQYNPRSKFVLDQLLKWLYRPSDPASLGIFRLLFGMSMIHDIMNERHMSHLDRIWGDPVHCHFPLFNFLYPASLAWMHVIYLFMLIGAICVALGIVFGFTVWMFVIPYWYLFLLDKTRWNNHSYLYGLVSILLSFTNAGNFLSVDSVLFPEKSNAHVPFWNYAILRFQIFLVYFIAGLKKLDPDWVTGWSMQNLSRHWVFEPFTHIMSKEMVDLLVVHGGGLFLDLFGGWLLLFDKTRIFALVLLSQFHVMNSQLFEIGMFPYVMLVTGAIFCHPEWPRKVGDAFRKISWKNVWAVKKWEESLDVHRSRISPSPWHPCFPSADCLYTKEELKPDSLHDSDGSASFSRAPPLRSTPSTSHKTVASLLIVYALLQCFLPYSHFLTKGYNLWTEGLYGYSWDMMVQSWSMQHIRVRFVDRESNETGFLNPDAMTMGMGRRWSSHPDMVKQYAGCVERKFQELNIRNFSLYLDVWRSMNGRFQQRMYDPRVDILLAEWSPTSSLDWTLPLLSELTDWRGKLSEIRRELKAKAEDAEEPLAHVVFVADFPGLFLENFVQPEIDEAFVELLDGRAWLEYGGSTGVQWIQNGTNLEPGVRVRVSSGEFHRVHTVGDRPSCYMYIFANSTDVELWRNLTRIKKTVDAMANLTESEQGRVWNFSNPEHVALFSNKSIDDPEIPILIARWKQLRQRRELESRPLIARSLVTFRRKAGDQLNKYLRAFEKAGKAVISIIEGISMEEYLSRERLARDKALWGDAGKGVTNFDDTDDRVSILDSNSADFISDRPEN